MKLQDTVNRFAFCVRLGLRLKRLLASGLEYWGEASFDVADCSEDFPKRTVAVHIGQIVGLDRFASAMENGHEFTIGGAANQVSSRLPQLAETTESEDRSADFFCPTSIVLCESAIDAISCSAIDANRICISTSGVRANPRWLKGLIARGYQIQCGFDADQPGDNAASQMISLYPTIQRLRPAAHDWNDVLAELR